MNVHMTTVGQLVKFFGAVKKMQEQKIKEGEISRKMAASTLLADRSNRLVILDKEDCIGFHELDRDGEL